MIEHLISLGLDPNMRNHENYAPIHICAKSGTAGIARTLISNGADPHLPLVMDRNSSPAIIAGENKNFEIVRVLRAFDAHYSFSHAINYGDIETMKAYLKDSPELAISGPLAILLRL
jgi:ankyrin repeat protein